MSKRSVKPRRVPKRKLSSTRATAKQRAQLLADVARLVDTLLILAHQRSKSRGGKRRRCICAG